MIEILAIIGGTIIAILSKGISRIIIQVQNNTFGFHFGEKDRRSTQMVIVIVGVFFALVSLRSLLI